jgi:trehalose 6-phosphate phosphatase
MNESERSTKPHPPFLPGPPSGWALFLDVDGTLVEIAVDPEAVVVTPRLVGILDRLQRRFGGAVALVSGRTVARLDALFAPLRLPAAGNHGLERRGADGRIVRPPEHREAMEQVRRGFTAFAAANPGTLTEDKELSVALHFRRVPACEAAAVALADRLSRAVGPGFRLQRGKMMIEIRPLGGDKGSVVDAFMAEPPFAGRLPVFVGDDVTDEDGFAAVNRRGGISVHVGGIVPTGARFRIANVPALLDWLERLAGDTHARG